jgi:hypothetical protein
LGTRSDGGTAGLRESDVSWSPGLRLAGAFRLRRIEAFDSGRPVYIPGSPECAGLEREQHDMTGKFLKWFAIVVLGIGLSALTRPVCGVETGTDTNQSANLEATNSITLRGSTITSWRGLTNSLDVFYIKTETDPDWTAVSNTVMTNAADCQTAYGWGNHASAGYITNAFAWSYFAAVSNIGLANKELTNVAAMTIGGERRTNWPVLGVEKDPIWSAVSNTAMTNAANGQTAYGWGNHALAGYLTNASTWSYYSAVSNVDIADDELTNVLAMTIGGERRTNWPGIIPQTITLLAEGAARSWSRMPAALAEWPTNRAVINFSNVSQVRITVDVVVRGQPSSVLAAQYSTNQTTWSYLDGVSGPSVAVSTTGTKIGGWVDISAVARQDVYVRLVGSGGNGSTTPQFGLITLQAK